MVLSSTTHSWHWVSVMSRASWLTMITAARQAKAVRCFPLTRGVCCHGNATQIHVHPWSHSLHLPELPDLTPSLRKTRYFKSNTSSFLCWHIKHFPHFYILLKKKKGNTLLRTLLLFLFAGLLLGQVPLTSPVLLCLLGAPPHSTLCWETRDVHGCCL